MLELGRAELGRGKLEKGGRDELNSKAAMLSVGQDSDKNTLL